MMSAVTQTPTRHMWSPLHALCAATWALKRSRKEGSLF